MAFNDEELSLEELTEVKAGIKEGKTDEMLNKLSKPELVQFKETIERELTLDELDNVKAAIPNELVEEMKNNNENLFRKM